MQFPSNGKRPVDPIKNIALKSVTSRSSNHPMRLIRQAVDAAIASATHEHVGGHRHMRRPLQWWEQEHHAQVDRFLRRLKEER